MLRGLVQFQHPLNLQPLCQWRGREAQHRPGAAGDGNLRRCGGDCALQNRLPPDGAAVEVAHRAVLRPAPVAVPVWRAARGVGGRPQLAADSVFGDQLPALRAAQNFLHRHLRLPSFPGEGKPQPSKAAAGSFAARGHPLRHHPPAGRRWHGAGHGDHLCRHAVCGGAFLEVHPVGAGADSAGGDCGVELLFGRRQEKPYPGGYQSRAGGRGQLLAAAARHHRHRQRRAVGQRHLYGERPVPLCAGGL